MSGSKLPVGCNFLKMKLYTFQAHEKTMFISDKIATLDSAIPGSGERNKNKDLAYSLSKLRR